MLREDYLQWFEERVGVVPGRGVPQLTPATEVVINWPLSSFRCDPFACQRVCCLTHQIPGGIPLLLADLLRLRDGGLLDSVQGKFGPSDQFDAFFNARPGATEPEFPRLKIENGHCVHYDSESRGCSIYEFRPGLCRVFPYEAMYDHETGRVFSVFCGGCSIAPAIRSGDAVGSNGLPMKPVQQLQLLRSDALPDGDRRGIESCLEQGRETLRTVHLLATRADLLDELGLEQFAPR